MLNQHRRIFDAGSSEDLRDYKAFLETGSWSPWGCPFQLEWPWLSIPHMINQKIAEHVTKKVRVI